MIRQMFLVSISAALMLAASLADPALAGEDPPSVTYDGLELVKKGRLDIVYRRNKESLERLVDVLASHSPYLRGAPRGLPFRWDTQTLSAGLNFTLTTDLGDLDLLGEITGGGGFEALLKDSIPVELFGMECRILSLEKLIEVKRAAGRPKDFEAIAELETIAAEQAS